MKAKKRKYYIYKRSFRRFTSVIFIMLVLLGIRLINVLPSIVLRNKCKDLSITHHRSFVVLITLSSLLISLPPLSFHPPHPPYFPIHPFIHPSIHLFIHPSIHFSLLPSTPPSLHLSIPPSLYPSVLCLEIYVSNKLYVYIYENISKLCISAHQLNIERERYTRLPRKLEYVVNVLCRRLKINSIIFNYLSKK